MTYFKRIIFGFCDIDFRAQELKQRVQLGSFTNIQEREHRILEKMVAVDVI